MITFLKLFLQWFSTSMREVMWAVTKLESAKDPRHTVYHTDCLNLKNSGYST